MVGIDNVVGIELAAIHCVTGKEVLSIHALDSAFDFFEIDAAHFAADGLGRVTDPCDFAGIGLRRQPGEQADGTNQIQNKKRDPLSLHEAKLSGSRLVCKYKLFKY